MKKLLLIPLLSMFGLACGDGEQPPPPSRPAHCNPLSDEGWCLLPWPSSAYLAKDTSTATGHRVSYPKAAMPKNESGVALDPTRYNTLDGFPIGSQIVAAFREGLSPQGLPGPEAPQASLDVTSPIWLLDLKSGERVPFFAELDANVQGKEAGLIIRPHLPLRWGTRYAVALRSTLRSASGGGIEPTETFRRIRDGLPVDASLQAEAARLREVLDSLESRGLRRGEVLLAWDFHTASEEAVAGQLRRMVEQALSGLPAGGPAFEITRTTDREAATEPNLLREVEGTFEAPSFLSSDDSDAWLKLDASGKPELRGKQRFPFVATIPRCAETATAPLPILIYGHGLFGSARDLLADYQKKLANRLCMVMVATDWLGLSEADLAAIPSQVLMDFSKVPRVTDRLQQAHVNFQVLVKLAKAGLPVSPALQVGGKPVADPGQLSYLGISNGGIQGTTFGALTADLERLVLNVAGAWWSLMMQRSSDFALLALLLDRIYTASLDRLLLFSLSQHLWEATDPIAFAPRTIATPLLGRPPKRVLLQEAKDDDQVPNLATRALVRALGLPGLTTMVEPVFGIPDRAGPLTSAYVQWDLKVEKIGPGNIPPPKRTDANSSHKLLRLQEPCIQQMQLFLRSDGQAVSTCQGACDPD